MDNIKSVALAPLPKNNIFLSLQYVSFKFSESLDRTSLAIVMAFFPALKAWLSLSIVSRYAVCLERMYFCCCCCCCRS